MIGSTRKALVPLALATAVLGGLATSNANPAAAHNRNDTIHLVSPLTDGDRDLNDITARWATTPGTEPGAHHRVFFNWGERDDIAVDIFAPPGTRVVTPFGSKTNTGHRVTSTVVAIGPTCASRNIAHGGHAVTVEARDTVTGYALGRAVLAHVNNPQVRVGQTLGDWTVIGWTARWGYNNCYQVSNDQGVHLHVEWTNQHRYACYIRRGNGAGLSEVTRIGYVGPHYGSHSAAC